MAENLEIWPEGDEFILELFKDEHSAHKELADALDEAASLILCDGPVDSVKFTEAGGVWAADVKALRSDLHAGKKRR